MKAQRAVIWSGLFAISVFGARGAAQVGSMPAGSINGIVVDSVRGGYLRDAIVSVVDGAQRSTTDSLGRFNIDDVPAGVLSIRVRHPLLDTLGITVVSAPRDVPAGASLSLIVGVPSPTTIVNRKCSTVERANGASALIGVVTDADTEAPSDGAEVVVGWTDFEVGRKTISKTPRIRSAKVHVDGSYLICGIPEDLVTGVYARRGTDSTASVNVNFGRRLSIQSLSMPASIEVSSASAVNASPKFTGSLTGTVVDAQRRPLRDARVSIEADEAVTVSGPDGKFILREARPGTRLLTVRKLGFQPVEMAVNVSSLRPGEVTLIMDMPVQTLEAVRVSAVRDIGLQKVGFAERTRIAAGKFYSPEDIRRRDPLKLNYLLETAPMLRSYVGPNGKRVINGRGAFPCLRYYIDGVLTAEFGPTDVDMLPDSYLSTAELGAVEVYGKLDAPAGFIALSRTGQVCSVVVIWTKNRLGI